MLTAATLWGTAAQAQTTFPDAPNLSFQTSAVRRCADIGDWYTTGGLGNTDTGTCGPAFGGGAGTINAPGFHTFFVNVSQSDLDDAGGSIQLTILDAESNGLDPGNGIIDESFDEPDPTEFTLLGPDGAVIDSRIFDGEPNGTNYDFPPITVPGVYAIRSRTGDFYINGPAFDSFERNNDDNSFVIQAPIGSLLIGELNGAFQQDTGGDIDLDLFFLVGPGTENLFLRNFDLDNGGDINYTSPPGTPIPGTTSGNEVWNGGGDLNNGGDPITLNPANTDEAGRWDIDLTNYTTNNQTVIEVEVEGDDTPIFVEPPLQAGNFTITPDTTLSTVIGTEVCHPFTVTNNFFTTDIVNLTLSGTDPNYTVELRQGDGTTPLTDIDGDGAVDTGILQVNETASFTLCVTPQPGAPPQDNTLVSGTSFMDVRVRQQAIADGIPGVDPNPDIQSVEKITLIPQIGLAKAISTPVPAAGQPGFFDFDLTYVVVNTGINRLTNVQITDDLQEVLVDNPSNNGADSYTVQGIAVTNFTGNPADAPTANTAYNGDTDQNLFANTPNAFEAGNSATVVLSVRVDLSSDGDLDTENIATATGIGPDGTAVSDLSQNGSDVDPDGNGNPTDNNVPTPINLNPDAGLVLIKRITNIFRQGIPIAVPGITSFNDQAGDTSDTELRDAFAAVGVVNEPAGIVELPDEVELEPNDEVEYTIFFWNNTAAVVSQVQICDELEPPSILSTAAGFGLSAVGPLATPTFGNAGAAVQGQSPGAPLADFCISAPGTFPFGPPGPAGGLGVGAGGGVTTGAFTVPANQFGAIRFRVRVP